jgi:predicted TIM-barrel fold metal-dependent hydrolase
VTQGSAIDRCVVVSSDSHVGPSVKNQLREYCEEKYLPAFDEYAERLARSSMVVDELSIDMNQQIKGGDNGLEERSQMPGLQDPHARLRDMDSQGVCADVIYHGGLNGEAVPFFNFNIAAWGSNDYNHLDPVGVHIYNRWLADFVSVEPERHVGVAHITVRDVDKAVAEAQWARSAGLTAINLPSPRRDFTPYTEPVWELLWAACEDLGLALCTHGGGGDLDTRHSGLAATAMFQVEYPWLGRRTVWQMIFSGVFERHPGLRLVFAEQFGDWVPATLKEMDSAYQWSQSAALRRELPRLPSEYFMENCWVGCSFMSHEEAVLGVEEGIVDKLVWGSDYPHPEGSFPYTTMSLRKTMAGLDRSVIDAYTGLNAVKAFRLDLSALRAVADRIGPTYQELQVPYGSLPGDAPDTVAFRDSLAFRDSGRWR